MCETSDTHVVTVAYAGAEYVVRLPATLQQLGEAIQAQVAAQGGPRLNIATMKLLAPKLRLALGDPSHSDTTSPAAAGIAPGMRLMLVASAAAEVEAVRSAKQLERLPSFEHERRREAMRRGGRGPGPVQLPQGPYTFAAFEVLQPRAGGAPLTPPPSAALRMLHRLAADPAIAKTMAARQWRVGLLSEMPPEGKVGISPVCILGVNINRGAEISLRLRTDNWAGLRQYAKVRETLVHELAHMVFDDHDNSFKALNSELLREVARIDAATAGGGRRLAAAAFDRLGAFSDDGEDDDAGPSGAARAPPPGGRTLGGAAAGAGAARAAAEAALLRQLATTMQRTAVAGSPPAQPARGGGGDDGRDGEAAAGTHAGTAAAEDAMRRLGSLESDQRGLLAERVERQWERLVGGQGGGAALESSSAGSSDGGGGGGGGSGGGSPESETRPADDAAAAAAAAAGVPPSAAALRPAPAAESAGPPRPQLPSTPPPPRHQQEDADALSGRGDPTVAALEAVRGLRAAAADRREAEAALRAVATLLTNLLECPEERRFRRVHAASNPAFQRRVGRFPDAVALLRLAGFRWEGAAPAGMERGTRRGEWLVYAGGSAAERGGALQEVLSIVRGALEGWVV